MSNTTTARETMMITNVTGDNHINEIVRAIHTTDAHVVGVSQFFRVGKISLWNLNVVSDDMAAVEKIINDNNARLVTETDRALVKFSNLMDRHDVSTLRVSDWNGYVDALDSDGDLVTGENTEQINDDLDEAAELIKKFALVPGEYNNFRVEFFDASHDLNTVVTRI